MAAGMQVKVSDQVLRSEYEGTKMTVDEIARAEEKAFDDRVKKTTQSALKILVDILQVALQRDLRILQYLGEAALFLWFVFKKVLKSGMGKVGL